MKNVLLLCMLASAWGWAQSSEDPYTQLMQAYQAQATPQDRAFLNSLQPLLQFQATLPRGVRVIGAEEQAATEENEYAGNVGTQEQTFLNGMEALARLQEQAVQQAKVDGARKNRELIRLGLTPIDNDFTGNAIHDNQIMMNNVFIMDKNIAKMEARGKRGNRKAAAWARRERNNQQMAADGMQQSYQWQQAHDAKVKAANQRSRDLIDLGNDALNKNRLKNSCMDDAERIKDGNEYLRRVEKCRKVAEEAQEADQRFQAR